MQITLYRGSEAIEAELNIDQETGEIMGDFPLDVLVQRNPIGTCAYVLTTLANADMIDAHIKTMQAKKKALQNNAERAKTALKEVMAATGVKSFQSDDRTFKAVLYPERDKSVDVFDQAQLPIDFMRQKVTIEPDKTLIAKEIESGFEVPGARIVKKDRLEIK